VRLLLIDPTDPWVTNNRVLKHHEQVMLPIGLMYLSAQLKRHLGDHVEVEILSTIVDLDGPAALAERIRRYAPDVIGIRCVIFYAEEVARIAATARAEAPGALVVVGGPNVTPDNDTLLANRDIDLFVEGEGEATFLDLVERLLRDGRDGLRAALPSIAGVTHHGAAGPVRNPTREPIEELDELPIPDYDAIAIDRYSTFLNYGYNRRPMGVLFTSRGCPFRCTYCHLSFGKSFRARSAANVFAEVCHLHERYGLRDFAIIDDNFTVERDRVREFTRLMIEQGPKVRFYFPNGVRADSLDADLLERMRDAGTIYMTFSLETASPRLQREIKKFTNVEKLRQVVMHSCELGIITNLCVMVGFPSETLDDARRTLEYFSQFDRLVLPYYFSVKYYPGTELFHTAGERGVIIDPERYRAPYHGYEFQDTQHLSRDDFERLNRWYLRHIYLNPRRLANAVSTLSLHFTEQEIKEMFTLFFRRKVTDIQRDVVQAGVA
jgi:radical SAM superfamily enzyme YgiQ (UPF0313 family)